MFCSLSFYRKRKLVAAAAIFLLFLLGVTGVSAAARSAVAAKGISLPIVMYHGMLEEKNRQGVYVVSPELFESDLSYLKEHGYTAVVVQDLIDYVDSGKPLPEKPVMLTFDDGYYNNYLYAYPLAKKYGMKIVISPIGIYTDRDSLTEEDHALYSHITWDQIREMMDSGYVEFQNHSYNLHGTAQSGRLGAQKRKSESVGTYRALLEGDLSRMQREMTEQTGYTPTAFVYPYGIVSRESVPVVKSMGFQATMNCENRRNRITDDPDCLFGMGRFLRTTGVSSEKFFSRCLGTGD